MSNNCQFYDEYISKNCKRSSSITCETSLFLVKCCFTCRILSGYNLPAVQFTIYMTRKYSYYLMNMLLPVIVLAVMAPFVFVLPVESGEKIGFALTILLSLSVVMTIVSDNIPPTSTHVCVLSKYMIYLVEIIFRGYKTSKLYILTPFLCSYRRSYEVVKRTFSDCTVNFLTVIVYSKAR